MLGVGLALGVGLVTRLLARKAVQQALQAQALGAKLVNRLPPMAAAPSLFALVQVRAVRIHALGVRAAQVQADVKGAGHVEFSPGEKKSGS